MKYKYLLFDLDGTLIDTTEGVLKSAQNALDHFGIHVELDNLMAFFGPPLKVSFTTLYGLTDSEADEAVRLYLERYEKKGFDGSRVYGEIPDLLSKLKKAGYKLGVATSKYEGHAIEALKHHGILDYFDYVTGASIDEKISKKHEVIEEAINRFNAGNERNSILMIGDMKYDIIGAKLSGLDSFGIYTGTAKEHEHEQAGATYIAYSFEDLEQYLLKILI